MAINRKRFRTRVLNAEIAADGSEVFELTDDELGQFKFANVLIATNTTAQDAIVNLDGEDNREFPLLANTVLVIGLEDGEKFQNYKVTNLHGSVVIAVSGLRMTYGRVDEYLETSQGGLVLAGL